MVRRRRPAIQLVWMFVLFLPALASAQNLIQNGDFSQGAVGFSTPYTLQRDLGSQGTYFIGSDPHLFNPFGPSFRARSGELMLIANGSGIVVPVWQQTVAVAPGTNYVFQGYVADWSNDAFGSPNPAVLQLIINGTIVTQIGVVTTDGIWTRLGGSWNSGSAQTATIQIVDTRIEGNGNDFALDDLCLTSAGDCRNPPALTPPNTGLRFTCVGPLCLGSFAEMIDAESGRGLWIHSGSASTTQSTAFGKTLVTADGLVESCDYQNPAPELPLNGTVACGGNGSATGSGYGNATFGKLKAYAGLHHVGWPHVSSDSTSAGHVAHGWAGMAELLTMNEGTIFPSPTIIDNRVARFTFAVGGTKTVTLNTGAIVDADFFARGSGGPCPPLALQCVGAEGRWQRGRDIPPGQPVQFDLRYVRGDNLLAQFELVASVLAYADPMSNTPFTSIVESDYSHTATLERIQLFEGTPESLGAEITDFTITSASGTDYNSYVRDTVPPATTLTATGASGDHAWYRGSVVLTLAASDNRSGALSTQVSIDGSSYAAVAGPISIASDGVHDVRFFSTDAAGNSESPHTVLIAVDATPPSISPSADITVTTETPAAIVNYALPAVSDATSGTESIVCQPTTGSSFQLGTTLVTCVATDVAGNTSTSSFAVAVRSVPQRRLAGSGYTFPETTAYRATFSIDATGPSSPAGSVKYYYARTRMNLASTSLTAVSVEEGRFSVSGTGTINGVSGFTFTTSGASGASGSLAITIYRPDGSVYYSAPLASVSGQLSISTP